MVRKALIKLTGYFCMWPFEKSLYYEFVTVRILKIFVYISDSATLLTGCPAHLYNNWCIA